MASGRVCKGTPSALHIQGCSRVGAGGRGGGGDVTLTAISCKMRSDICGSNGKATGDGGNEEEPGQLIRATGGASPAAGPPRFFLPDPGVFFCFHKPV